MFNVQSVLKEYGGFNNCSQHTPKCYTWSDELVTSECQRAFRVSTCMIIYNTAFNMEHFIIIHCKLTLTSVNMSVYESVGAFWHLVSVCSLNSIDPTLAEIQSAIV